MTLNLRIFVTLFLAVFVTTLGAGLVAPLLPLYARDLGASTFQIGLIFASFSLTRSLFLPYFGRQSDRKGRKPFLTAGLFIYFLLSLFFVLSEDVYSLILLRLAQGFASAMILPVAQAYVGKITPPQSEGVVMGLFNVSLYGGLSFGPLLGGVVKDWLDIRYSFMSMGFLALIGFTLCLLLLPAEPDAKKGASAPARLSIRYFELIKDRSVLSLFVFRASFTTCIGMVWAFLPLLAGNELALSSSAIGVIVMMNVFVSGLFQIPMGFLADRVSKRFLVVSGGLMAAGSILCLTKASTFAQLLAVNGLLGLAGGVSFPAVMALGVIEGRRIDAMGSLMGLLALAHSIGMLVGPLLAGTILAFFSFSSIFILGAVTLGAGTLLFWRNG